VTRRPYRQALPALALSIERYTPNVPADGAWYVLKDGQEVGRFRTLKAARKAWDAEIASSDWSPTERPVDAKEAIARERGERWARNRGG
jgi:hypothetical protein